MPATCSPISARCPWPGSGSACARRPADWKRTYGFDRFQVLVAFANGLALFAIAAWIVLEAVERLGQPQPVAGGIA